MQSYKKATMSKGINSRNSLKALAFPIQRFIAGWGALERPSQSDGMGSAMPAPYELAALRGEGILRERFFQRLMKKMPVALDAGQQIALWNELVEDGGHITAWVQRLGVARALRREAVMPEQISNESRKLYCLLLDTLVSQTPELLPWAVEGYFWHVWRARQQCSRNGTIGITQGCGTIGHRCAFRGSMGKIPTADHVFGVHLGHSYGQPGI